MNELIFRSEVESEVNWVNPDSEGLLTCQFDDGITVHNCITGATGEVFDSANELGISTGISATWSSAKPVGIDDNPLALLVNKNDTTKRYGLKLETNSHQISIPFNSAYDINVIDSDDVATNYTGSGVLTIDGTTPTHIKSIEGTDTDGFQLFSLDKTQGESVQSETSSLIATLVGFPEDSGYVRGDTGEIIGYVNDGVGTYLDLGDHDFNIIAEPTFKVRLTADLDSGGEFYLGSTGSNTSYIRFRKDAVSVRYYTSSRVDDTFDLSAYSGVCVFEIERVSDTLQRFYCNGDLIVENTKDSSTFQKTATYQCLYRAGSYYGNTPITIERLEIISPSINRDFDFTSGDDEKIIETLQGKHAIINNGSTVKWQPILDKFVTYIGTGLDYNNLADHRIGEKGQGDVIHEAVITENVQLSAEVRYYANEFKHLILKGDVPFNGVLGHADNRSITSDGVMTDSLFQLADKLEIYNIDFESSTGNRVFILDTGAELNLQDFGIYSPNHYGLLVANGKITGKRGKVLADSNSAVYDTNASGVTELLDCDIRGNSDFGAVRNRFGSMHLTNNVIRNINPSGAVTSESGGLTGSHNVTEDVSHTANGMTQGVQVTLTRDSDDRISETDQAALKGQGWNGSDIVSWAYAPIDSDGGEDPVENLSVGLLQLSSFSISAVVDNTPTVNVASATIVLPALSLSATVVNTAQENTASGSFVLKALTLSGNVVSGNVLNNISLGAFNLQQNTFNGSVDNSTTSNSMSGFFSLPTYAFSGLISHENGQNLSSGSFSIPGISFSSVITNTAINNESEGDFVLPALTFDGLLDTSHTENISTVSFRLTPIATIIGNVILTRATSNVTEGSIELPEMFMLGNVFNGELSIPTNPENTVIQSFMNTRILQTYANRSIIQTSK